MSVAKYDECRAQETVERFALLVPGIAAREDLVIDTFLNIRTDVYVPIVYRTTEETGGCGMPSHYIEIRRVGDNTFHIRFDTMLILVGAGIPATWWPESVSGETLEKIILYVFEEWDALQESQARSLVHLTPPEALPL